MLKMLVNNGFNKPYSVKDIRELQKKLKAIEPKLRTEFMREVKAIGKQPEQSIKNAIKARDPLSGMDPMKRGAGATLQWGRVRKGKQGADSTTIRFRTAMSGRSLTTSLLTIRVNSAATAVSDMAGRSGRSVGAGYRGSGWSKTIIRTYKDGSQSIEFNRRATKKSGLKFLENLDKRFGNRASRMAWKAVEKDIPKISKTVQYVVDKWSIKASKGF